MARKYDREFKLEAIHLALEEGSTAVEVERRLGLSEGTISRWKKQLKDKGDEAFPGTGHLSDRDEEVRRLRRELGRVTRERDILKKAVSIFSERQ
jgi:transposase|tara:strand:- start:535 stop:819 length:285 start_codon:yes stop_codon:yes gene_type:complete